MQFNLSKTACLFQGLKLGMVPPSSVIAPGTPPFVIGIEVVSLSGSIAVYVRRHGARKKTLLCDNYHDSD